ncbi:vascular cell adhesion protein 1-like isoform X2 [Hemitrygon akajei]|uniref:vascular cell adhesion protein 1-like isoform X2 n=1 Tax=Hemitrygon akajei TaxID=2704970 RepID=UPI003BF9D91A
MYFRSISLVAFLFVVTDKLNGFEVLVNTSRQAVEFGESLEVTCSTTCNSASIIMEYRPGLNPIRTPGDKWITDRLPSVQSWDLTLPCTVICPSAKPTVKEDKRVVPVYNRNLSVVPPPEVLEVNKPYQLECTGPKVYPKNRLLLTWLRGSEVVQRNSTEDPGFPEDGPLKNVLNFIASSSDNGMVYTCLAELILDSKTTTRIANASVTLQTHYKLNGFEVLVNTSRQAVEFGESLEVTCGTTCNNPSIIVEYRPGLNPHRTHGDKWITDRFPSVQKWDFTVPCTVICVSAGKQVKEDKRVVPVYNKLNGFEVLLSTSRQAVEFGESLEVTCGTTCNNASIIVEYRQGLNPHRTHGDKWIRDRFPSVQKWDFTVPCTVICPSAKPTVKEDRRVVPVYNRNLSIVPPPEVLEVNKPYQLECTGPKVYPKNRLLLTWLRGSEVVQRNYTWDPGFPEDGPLKNILHFIASISDDGMVYTCLAELILDSKTTKWIANSSVTLQTYFFSNPEIHIPITTEGIPVNITCSVLDVTGELQLRLKKGSEILVNRSANTGLTIYHTVNPRAELNGQQFTCEAELTRHHHSNTIVKRQSAVLNVQYK